MIDFGVTSGDLLTAELPESETEVAYLVGPARVVYEGHAELKET